MSACLAIIVKNLACRETHVSAIDIDCETFAKAQICRMFSYLVQEGYSWHSLFLNNPTLILAYVFGGYLENGLKVHFFWYSSCRLYYRPHYTPTREHNVDKLASGAAKCFSRKPINRRTCAACVVFRASTQTLI